MKLFKVLQQTNYGEWVALVAANTIEEAKQIIIDMNKDWDINDIEEIIIPNEPMLISINGGDQG